MAMMLMKISIVVFSVLVLCSQNSDAQYEDYCIADEQTPDGELQAALKWACENGADCRLIQPGQPCFTPDNVKDHASFAFNSYYQNMKHKGGSCYFNSAALLTAANPSKPNITSEPSHSRASYICHLTLISSSCDLYQTRSGVFNVELIMQVMMDANMSILIEDLIS